MLVIKIGIIVRMCNHDLQQFLVMESAFYHYISINLEADNDSVQWIRFIG